MLDVLYYLLFCITLGSRGIEELDNQESQVEYICKLVLIHICGNTVEPLLMDIPDSGRSLYN